MRLPDARRAVEEERVIGLGRQLGHRQGSGMSEAITATDHEALERVLGVQAAARGSLRLTARPSAVLWLRRRPICAHHLDHHPIVEKAGSRSVEQRQVALAYPAADVLRRPYVERASLNGRQLERMEPDVELEVGGLPAELLTDLVPDRLGFAHRRTAPSHGGTGKAYSGWRTSGPAPTCPRWVRVYTRPRARRRRACRKSRRFLGGSDRAGSGERFRRRPRVALVPLAPGRYPARLANEAHLPAQEAQACPHARVPGAHANARRSPDPEAPARQGPAPADALGMARPREGDDSPRERPRRRRQRLSRSAEVARVYKEGRSHESRHLVV